jgi:hypothetical protein
VTRTVDAAEVAASPIMDSGMASRRPRIGDSMGWASWGGQVGAGGMAVDGKVRRRVQRLSVAMLLVTLPVASGTAPPGTPNTLWTYAAPDPSSPTRFTAADHSFSVIFPAKPQTKPAQRLRAGIVVTIVTAQSSEGEAGVTDLTIDPAVHYNQQRGMRGGVDELAKSSGGTVSDYSPVPFGRYQGAVATMGSNRRHMD